MDARAAGGRAGLGRRGRRSCPTGGSASSRRSAARSRVWERGRGVSRYAYTAGGPNSCVLGDDGVLYVCQNGGTVGSVAGRGDACRPRSSASTARAARPRSSPPSSTGIAFNGPNDLVFGPDGRLYFTDPGTYRPADPEPSYLFVLEADGSGRLLAELDPPTFPNGIAIEADGSVVWAESYTGMVRRLRLDTGAIEDIARLPGDKPVADGMAVGRRRPAVRDDRQRRRHRRPRARRHATTGSSRPASIPTNCVFDGTDLYHDRRRRRSPTRADASYGGQLWRLAVGTSQGLPTWHGRIGTSTAGEATGRATEEPSDCSDIADDGSGRSPTGLTSVTSSTSRAASPS